MKTKIIPTDEKVCAVDDWGTETSGEPRKITRIIFKTNMQGFYEIYTGRSSHSGLYSHESKSEIVSTEELKRRYTYQLNGIDL